MRRDQLEHILRAAADVAGSPDVVVIGSQAILGSFDETQLPDAAVASIEADIAFLDDPAGERSDTVTGAIGELSQFHETFGVYAEGVSVTTATLPMGWRDRVVLLDTPNTQPGRGICLEPHDLAASKLVAVSGEGSGVRASASRRRVSRSRGATRANHAAAHRWPAPRSAPGDCR
jgi:hypothetical protein